MKCKKILALVMAAVLAVSMLTACGGGGGVVKDQLNTSQVNSLLADANIEVKYSGRLSDAVRAGASEIAKTGSTGAAQSKVKNAMGWGFVNTIQNAWNNFVSSGGILTENVSFGQVYVVASSTLENNVGAGGWTSIIGAHKDIVADMAPINTPEKYAATLVLSVDGTVGLVSDVTNSRVGLTYNVSGYEVEDPNGVNYWIFAAQITVG